MPIIVSGFTHPLFSGAILKSKASTELGRSRFSRFSGGYEQGKPATALPDLGLRFYQHILLKKSFLN
jgi:hypothetical protein